MAAAVERKSLKFERRWKAGTTEGNDRGKNEITEIAKRRSCHKLKEGRKSITMSTNCDENLINGRANEAPAFGKDVELQDIDVMRKWVKEELFHKVRFVYDKKKDLEIGGLIYSRFVLDCRERLVGLKKAGSNKQMRMMYVKMLWTKANNSANNLVRKGLGSKRTSIYTAMNNQFIGKWSTERISTWNFMEC